MGKEDLGRQYFDSLVRRPLESSNSGSVIPMVLLRETAKKGSSEGTVPLRMPFEALIKVWVIN